jgi:hypothetical protein
MKHRLFDKEVCHKHTFYRILWFAIFLWHKKYRHEMQPQWGIQRWSVDTPVISISIWLWYDVLQDFRPWLKAHLPVWCKRCNYVMFARNARYARMTTGASVPLCEKCYHEIYTPFGGE